MKSIKATIPVTFVMTNLSDSPLPGPNGKLNWAVRCSFEENELERVKQLMIPYRVTRDAFSGKDSYFFTASRPSVDPKTGTENSKPPILNKNKEPYHGSLELVGKRGLVQITVMNFVKTGRKRTSTFLNRVIVI